MPDQQTTPHGRIARWLLLAWMLFGLEVMDALGHAGMRIEEHHHHQVGVTPAAAMAARSAP